MHLPSAGTQEGKPGPPRPTAAPGLRTLAERVASALSRYDDVVAVALLGSVARGDARPESDIDLVVVTHHEVRRSHLLRRLPPALWDVRVSLMSYTTARLSAEAGRGSLFMDHVRREGVSLYDPQEVLRGALEVVARARPDVEGDIRRRVGQLRLYRDLARLNGQHLSALSHLYAIGKGVAIARCAELEAPIFVKQQALQRLADLRPDLADQARMVARLRPFYDATAGRGDEALPFEPVNADREVEQAIGAIERMACG